MKIVTLFVMLLLLGGCATVPFCKKDQTTDCKKIGAGDMNGTVRGVYEKAE